MYAICAETLPDKRTAAHAGSYPYGSSNSSASGSNDGLIQDFVTRSGTRFVVQAKNGSQDSCETFYFAGANTYYLVRASHGLTLKPWPADSLTACCALL